MKCVILQPSYIPWRGYFDLIHKADVFVFYDDVQYDKHGWRNRNRIKTPSGVQWLTIPVLTKGKENLASSRINSQANWEQKHEKTLHQSYGKAPYFADYISLLKQVYERQPRAELLVDVTIELTITLARALGIRHTNFVRSSELHSEGTKTERLINILQTLGATHYISGPSAKNYLQEDEFRRAAITLEYARYDYPEYTQLYPPFDPQVSILDLLFMQGPDAFRYIWGT